MEDPIAEFYSACTPDQRTLLRARLSNIPTHAPGCVYGFIDKTDRHASDTKQFIKIGRTSRPVHIRAAEWGLSISFVVYTQYSHELETRAHKLFAYARVERLGPAMHSEHEWFHVNKYANILGAIQALNDTMDTPIIRVPTRSEARLLRININTATVAQLRQLPGIGAELAPRIVAYRTSHGNFKNIYDLLNIHGIAEKRLAKIANLVIT